MSDLLEQLRKRKQQEGGTGFKSLHVRPSLLFEYKEAAKIELTAIHLLAINGLEQLVKQEPRIKPFEQTLFAPAAKEISREAQTADVNKRLDESIDSLLSLLSPYFLLKATHKCLEFLIRRYNIHEFNRDAVMKCILPFHQTNTFVRMVQLLRVKNTVWQFLEPVQKSGAAPPRKVLVERCASDRALLLFICNMVKDAVTERTAYKQLFTFYTATILELLNMHDVTESLVRDLWPFLITGVSSSNEGYQVSSLMLLSCLCWRVSLSHKLISGAVLAIASRSLDHLHPKALMTLVILMQNAKIRSLADAEAVFPDEAVELLVEWSDLTAAIAELVTSPRQYNVAPFLDALLTKLVSLSDSKAEVFTFLQALVAEVPVEKFVPRLVQQLLALYDGYAQDKESFVHTEQFGKLLRQLDSSYPTQFDQGIDQALQRVSNEPAWKQLFKDSRHQLVKTPESAKVSTLQLCLRQSTPKLKMHALESLLKMHRKQGAESTMGSLLERSLLEHLSSDLDEVVLHALQVQGLDDVVEAHALFSQLQRLVMSGSSNVAQAAVRVMTRSSFINKDKSALISNAVPVLLSALLCRDADLRAVTMKECESFPHPLFANLRNSKPSDDEHARLISALATSVASHIGELHQTVTDLFKEGSAQFKAIGLLIVSRAMALARSRQVQYALARLIMAFLSQDFAAISSRSSLTAFPEAVKRESGLPPCAAKTLESLAAAELSSDAPVYHSLLMWVLWNIIAQVASSGSYDEHNSDIMEQSFKLILSHPAMPVFQSHLQQLFSFLGKRATRFLELFWTSSGHFSALELVRALNMCAALLSDGASNPLALFEIDHLYVMMAGLLVPLTHSSMHVRVAAIGCVRGLYQVFSVPAVTQNATEQKLTAKFLPLDQLAAFMNFIGEQAASIQSSQSHIGRMMEQKCSPQVQKYLLSRAIALPHRFAQVSIFTALRHTPNGPKLHLVLPVAQELFGRASPQGNFSYLDAKLLDLILAMYAPDVAAHLDATLFDFFLEPISNVFTINFDKRTEQVIKGGNQNHPDRLRFCVSQCALASISPKFFAALSAEHKRTLFVRLCHLILSSPYYVRDAVQATIRAIVVPSQLIQEELELLAEKTSPAEQPSESSSKRRKQPEQPAVAAGAAAAGSAPAKLSKKSQDLVGRLTVLLEMFQQREDTVLGGVAHVPALFKLLSNVIEPSSPLAQDPSNEYIEQLVLSALIMITSAIAYGLAPEKAAPAAPKPAEDAMEVDTAPANGEQQQKPTVAAHKLIIRLSPEDLSRLEKHYSVDIIVRAIRSRQNPTLHNSALMLLSHIARVFPQKVLANIMSVFSFMGASSQRSDDNYTFIVIQKTVERVIPALLSAEAKLDGSRISASSLINVFVERFDNIPVHRRLLLFTLVLKILRGKSYLPYVLVHLFKKQQEQQQLEQQKISEGIVSEKLLSDDDTSVSAFSQSLLQKFSPSEAISCLSSLVSLMNDARDQLEATSLSHINLTGVDRVQLMNDGVDFICNYVVSKPFINQLLALSSTEEEKMQEQFLQLFRSLLVLFARTSDQHQVSVNTKQSKADQHRWFEISERVYEALERVNDLLSVSSFVQVIGSLLQHKDPTIQQKALLLFNDKLTQQQGLIADAHISLFLQLTQQLFTAITADSEGRAHLAAVNKQTAALTVEIVARQFGSMEPYTETFLGLAQQVTQHLAAYTTQREADADSAKVQSSMLVAIATLCSSLGQQLLPLLNEFFPAILHTLKSATTSMSGQSVDDNQRLLQLSALSSLQVIIRTLGRFLSTYMSDLLTSLLQPALLQFGEQMVSKVRSVLELIAENVKLRSLVAPLTTSFTTLKSSDAAKSMTLLMEFAGAVAKHMTRPDIQSQHRAFFNFFKLAFDYRASVSVSGSSKKTAAITESILAVEDAVIANFCQLVLRLNEAMFKPLFINIVDWAQINNSAVLQSEAGYNPARSLFFYRLLTVLADNLKSIFVPYYTYCVDHAIAILKNPASQQCIASHIDPHLLICSVLSALQKCFLYDTEQWMDKDKFNKLMPALVEQLETVRIGTTEQYRERMSRYLVPCIGQLAVCINHDSLWKPLNYQVLLKSRSSNTLVRYASLLVVDEFYHRLGEEFLVLLPESIQFFSELLEDSSEDVEDQMLKLVKRIEDLLGEEGGLMNLLQ